LESISTINFGTPLVQQSEVFPIKGLAAKARRLANQKNSPEENGLNPAQATSGKNNELSKTDSKDKELMEVAKKFEAILIHQMLKAMRKTVHKSDLLNSFSLQQYESMMDEEIASEMVKHKGIGLADNLFYQLSRLENNSNSPDKISNNF
jgi:flagellar protein FlgJ